MKPLVSVLVPVHNGISTVERALSSVLGQTHEAVEAIVVDDGSVDGSWELILSIAQKDPRVIPIRREVASGGPAVPRNIALSRAKGDLYALLDQDDEWLPEKLERQLPLFRDASLGIVYSDAWTSEGHSYLGLLARHGDPPEGQVVDEILRWCFVPACTGIWRKEVTELIGGFAEDLSSIDDHEYWMRAARAGVRFGYVPEKLARYATAGEHLSHDRMLNSRLVIRLWEKEVAASPHDPFARATLVRARRYISHYWAREALSRRGSARVGLLWRALVLCPEPRNILKILSGRATRRPTSGRPATPVVAAKPESDPAP